MKKSPSASEIACDQQQYCRAAHVIVKQNIGRRELKPRTCFAVLVLSAHELKDVQLQRNFSFTAVMNSNFDNDAIIGSNSIEDRFVLRVHNDQNEISHQTRTVPHVSANTCTHGTGP